MIGSIQLLKRATPAVLALSAVTVVVLVAYKHGVTTEGQRWQAKYNASIAAANQAKADAEQNARAIEQKAAKDQATIEEKLLSRMKDAQATANRTITDLRTGNIRLRNELTSANCTIAGVSNIATGASQRDAACSGGLRPEHAELLVRLADRADQVAMQLQAAQAVIVADRQVCGVSE